jgi:hypothetical protein
MLCNEIGQASSKLCFSVDVLLFSMADPLIAAAISKNLSMAKLLYQNGADVNSSSKIR